MCTLCQTEEWYEREIYRKKAGGGSEKRDGMAPKFVSPGFNGMPDRIVLLPSGKMAFVELKAPGEQMRPIQVKRKRQLERLGFSVYCIDEVEQIEDVLDEIGGDV